MIHTAALIGLLAATASPAPSVPVAVEFFRTFTASPVSGDPGAPTVAVAVRQATACDLTTGLGEPVPGVRLTVDGKVVYDSEAPPAGAETEPDPDAGVVLRADAAALLALVPSDAPTGDVTLSCQDRTGTWVDVVNEPWRHDGFDDMPLAMPDVVAEPGQPLTVYDIWGIYQASDPVVFQMKIDAEPATVSAGENAGAMQVSLPSDLPPGLHEVTVQTGEKVMTVPFIQRGQVVREVQIWFGMSAAGRRSRRGHRQLLRCRGRVQVNGKIDEPGSVSGNAPGVSRVR